MAVRVPGKDAIFLYMETPTTHMNVVFGGVFDPSTMEDATGDPGEIFDRVRELHIERAHLFPPFRQRIMEVPFQLDNPVLIEDPDFDLDYHLRRAALPAPGGQRELEDFIARVAGRPLDRRRPLWESYVVEGLEGGRWAWVTKAHHVIVDGMGGNAALIQLLDLSPERRVVDPPEQEWSPSRAPSSAELVGGSIAGVARRPWQLVMAAQRTTTAVIDTVSWKVRGEGKDADIRIIGPRTFLNGEIGPHRQITLGKVSLDDVKSVKKAAGCTVNDVVLAMCGRGLRKFLRANGEDPGETLVAAVPISIRGRGEAAESGGNQVSGMTVPFYDDVDDPAEQLRLINLATKPAKEQLGAVAATMMQEWSEFAPPAVAAQAFRFYSRAGLAKHHPPIANITLSNVPGPPFHIYMAGSRMDAMYPIGPVIHGQALNITVVSYVDQMHIGVVADRDTVPDIRPLIADIEAGLRELMEAVIGDDEGVVPDQAAQTG